MSPLLRKEIRLLLPAWIAAMLFVIAPIPLGLLIDDFTSPGTTMQLPILGLAIGCVFLGLGGFGREISSRTLSLLLAQPHPRKEYWRAKIGVLLVSLVALALFLGLVSWQLVPPDRRWVFALICFVAACVALTGGLWTTLLFRQIIASFWVAVLVPVVILVAIVNLCEEDGTRTILATVLLLTYSIAGYLFARWQFLHAQDTAWTGGNVVLPGFMRWLPWKRAETVQEKTHPLWALLKKEFQFQQVNFLLAGLLLLVQCAVLLVHQFANTSQHSVLDMIVQGFWIIWIVMPLLVGCGAVAEERKLSTLEPQLCLPVARRSQFSLKVFATLACGLVLGAFLPVVLAVIHPNGAAPSGKDFIFYWSVACVCLALVSLYASSLSNHLLQALVTAMGIMLIGFLVGYWFAGNFSRGYFVMFGAVLWRGPLVLIVGGSVMLLCAMVLTWRRMWWVWISLLGLVGLAIFRGEIYPLLTGGLATDSHNGFEIIKAAALAAALCPMALALALAARNFKHTQASSSLWKRNAVPWVGCLLFTSVPTTLVYNRVWELAMRFEPPAGPPRMSGSEQPIIAGSSGDRLTFVLLPDGRLCSFQEYNKLIPSPDSNAGGEPTLLAIKNPKVEFIGGSNWVSIATTRGEFGGVKSDGSLWRASWYEPVDDHGNALGRFYGVATIQQKYLSTRRVEFKFERFGSKSNWMQVAAGRSHFVALKREGTIWGWGKNENKQLGDAPKFVGNAPVQIGQSTNWVAVYAGAGHSYAVNRAGAIWRWGKFEVPAASHYFKTEEGPVKLNINVPGVRSIVTMLNDSELVLDTDGNLWGLGRIPAALTGKGFGYYYHSEPIRLGGRNWLSVSCNWDALVGLKRNGSLWCQRAVGLDFYNPPLPKLMRLGKRTDWIAVMAGENADFALANDGTICRFGEPILDYREQLLAPTRRVTWSANPLNAVK